MPATFWCQARITVATLCGSDDSSDKEIGRSMSVPLLFAVPCSKDPLGLDMYQKFAYPLDCARRCGFASGQTPVSACKSSLRAPFWNLMRGGHHRRFRAHSAVFLSKSSKSGKHKPHCALRRIEYQWPTRKHPLNQDRSQIISFCCNVPISIECVRRF
jgi:hypothetical protein